ncbi:MAG: hypothetical protein A2096_03920 [Spirochaetes bacterium GWF1_41_5]|nr:MAG: hypothetical protein A2096_03920 [Spirochaetes bacterium GWF1_41_5]
MLAFDFENQKLTGEGIPDGFRMWGANEYKIRENYAYDNKNAKNGKYSLRIHQPAGSKGYLTLDETLAVKVEPLMTYTITFWAKSDLALTGTKEDKLTRSFIKIEPYASIDPRKGAGTKAIPMNGLGTDWMQFSFEITESVEFKISEYPFLMFDFIAAPNWTKETIAKTLWIDDFKVTAAVTGREKALARDDLPKPVIPYLLKEGAQLEITINSAKITGKANRRISGVSIGRLTSGPTRIPYNEAGEYNLPKPAEDSIRELCLPLTRNYDLSATNYGAFPLAYNLFGALDRMAELALKFGIPQENIALEFAGARSQKEDKTPLLTPAEWASGVKYSLDKKYAFRNWEICNEPYTPNYSDVFKSSSDYTEYVKSVSQAIKKVHPDALIGIAIHHGELIEWREKILKDSAGYYDWAAAHHYNFASAYEKTFEDIVIGENSRTLESVLMINALLKKYNPGKNVYQYDTEWGMHGRPEGETKHPAFFVRNANITGALHRVVRMIYYATGKFVEGATGWVMTGRTPENMGFGIIPEYAPEKQTMLYWVYYYMNRFIGSELLETAGTAPYYRSDKDDLREYNSPLVPVLATISKDGSRIFIVMANGSWKTDLPCRVTVNNFIWKKAEGILLSHDNPDAHPVLDKKDDFVKPVNIMPAAGGKISMQLPRHSALFLELVK